MLLMWGPQEAEKSEETAVKYTMQRSHPRGFFSVFGGDEKTKRGCLKLKKLRQNKTPICKPGKLPGVVKVPRQGEAEQRVPKLSDRLLLSCRPRLCSSEYLLPSQQPFPSDLWPQTRCFQTSIWTSNPADGTLTSLNYNSTKFYIILLPV